MSQVPLGRPHLGKNADDEYARRVLPELPEVEIVRKQLSSVWLGRRIERVESVEKNYFFVTSPRTLQTKLKGRTLCELKRHGKSLIAHLDDGSRLHLHLGMTGQFVSKRLPQDGHVHLVLYLSESQVISFRDVRKFGKVEWLAPGKSSRRLDKLGPDALTITPGQLLKGLSGRRLVIKAALLHQEILAGIGNIYADEILFKAHISPFRISNDLSIDETKRIARAIISILTKAVKSGGSSISDYIQPDGSRGAFQDSHKVYGKTGKPCPQCQTPILRKTIGGRSSHYCKNCQI